MALSNEDFLKKNSKDLAKLNAAIAQGAIEFPEKRSKGFIQDQIAEIDGKALTQKDADEKRKKAL